MKLSEALRNQASVCPCSVPKPKEVTSTRRYPMEICGPEGCRRCRGTGVSAYCVDCHGTGAVTERRPDGYDVVTCPTCDGVGRHPVQIVETVNVQGALL